ncbi:MAG: ComEC/Rec2 family competence protein [Pseudomonadota bacterium]
MSVAERFGPIMNVILLQKDRLILWCPVMFAVGVGIYFSLKHEPNLTLSCISFVLFAFMWGAGWKIKEYKAYGHFLWLFGGAFCLISAGLVTAQLRTQAVYTPMLEKRIAYADVIGTIDFIETQEAGRGSRIIFKDVEIEELSLSDTPRKIRLLVRKDEGLRVGDRVSMLAGLNPPSPPVSPGAFDFQRYAYFKGLGAVGFVYRAPEVLERSGSGAFLKSLQAKMGENIRQVLDFPEAAFAMALMTGQRGAITDEDKKAMRDAGLAHLLAISGMHVGMVAGALFFASRLLMALWPAFALNYPIKKIAAVIALIGVIFYTFLVGASVPTQRALMMTGLVLIAIMVDRSPLSLRIVAIAAFVVLFISPESLMSVSFQMSFAAVIALISFYDAFRDQWGSLYANRGLLKRIGVYGLGIIITTIVAEIAIAPFALFHFQHHSVYGLLGNLMAVPVMAFVVMPMLVLSACLMPLGLDFIPLHVAGFGIDLMLKAAYWTSGLEGSVFNPPSFDPKALLFVVIGGLFLCFCVDKARLASVPFFVIALILTFQTKQPDILVSDKADLIALRGEDNKLVVSTRQKNKYAVENWLRMNGQEGEKPERWPSEGAMDGFALQCDDAGCRGELKGYKIAIAHDQGAWQEDCRWAEIMIASIPVDDCAAPYTVDRFSVHREGAHSIYLDETVTIKTVERERGARLWAGY